MIDTLQEFQTTTAAAIGIKQVNPKSSEMDDFLWLDASIVEYLDQKDYEAALATSSNNKGHLGIARGFVYGAMGQITKAIEAFESVFESELNSESKCIAKVHWWIARSEMADSPEKSEFVDFARELRKYGGSDDRCQAIAASVDRELPSTASPFLCDLLKLRRGMAYFQSKKMSRAANDFNDVAENGTSRYLRGRGVAMRAAFYGLTNDLLGFDPTVRKARQLLFAPSKLDRTTESVVEIDAESPIEDAAGTDTLLQTQEQMQEDGTQAQGVEALSLEAVLERAAPEDGFSTEELAKLKHFVDAQLNEPKDEAKQAIGKPLETKPLAALLAKKPKKQNSDPPPTLDELGQTFATATKMVTDVGEITDDLTSKQWGQVMEVSRVAMAEKHKLEIKERFNNACQAIEELRELEEVTAKDLTLYFAKKHKAARVDLKRTEGEVLPDKQKRELVEIVEAFRAIGGLIKLDGTPCMLELNKTGSMKQHRFSCRALRRVDPQKKNLWSNIKVPLLKFSKD